MQKIKGLIYKYGYPVIKVYWFFRRPTTAGVRCIVRFENQILLIRHTYGSVLRTTVGGGINKNESPDEAVIREVGEETGINIENLQKVGIVQSEKEFKKDTIHVFVATTRENTLHIDPAEIKEAGWYKVDELPADISPLFKNFFALAEPFLPKPF